MTLPGKKLELQPVESQLGANSLEDSQLNKSEFAIAFKNITFKVNKFNPSYNSKSKTSSFKLNEELIILDNITGYIPKKSLCAVIGPSGAGKTTLLGICGGIALNGTLTGSIVSSSHKISFVSQHPSMPQEETVLELIEFAAHVIDNPSVVSPKETTLKIKRIMKILNLIDIRNRQIKYLSGGEKKRVSIGIQLVTSPDILILDEPTSGLDTPNALSLVQKLKNIVNNYNCTIIVSIHQPQRRICDLFTWVLSIAKGKLLFEGTFDDSIICRNKYLNNMQSALNSNNSNISDESSDSNKELLVQVININEYFNKNQVNKIGDMYNITLTSESNSIDNKKFYHLIEDIKIKGKLSNNPADYLLETEYLSTIDKYSYYFENYRNNSNNNYNNMILSYINNGYNLYKSNNSKLDISRELRAFIGLLWRSIRYYKRNSIIVLLNWCVSIVGGFVLGGIYGKLSTEQEDIQNRFGSLGFMLVFIGIQSVALSNTFIEQRSIFIDERNGRLYNTISFFLGRSIPDLLLLRIIPSVLFSIIIFFILSYQSHTLDEYIIVIILLSISSSLFVYSISCLLKNSYTTSLLSTLLTLLLILYSGLFIQNSTNITWILKWPKYISFYNNALEILFSNEMSGLVFTISDATVNVNGFTVTTDGLDVTINGDYFIKFFGFNKSNRSRDYYLLISWIILYFVISIIGLQYFHRSKR